MKEPAPSTDPKLEITETIVRPYTGEGPIKAFVDVIFNNSFKVYGFSIAEERDKECPGRTFLRVRNPNRKDAANKYVDIAHPINKETFNHIVRTLLSAYKEALVDQIVPPVPATPAEPAKK